MEEQEQHKQMAAFWLNYSQQLSTAIRYNEALTAIENAINDAMNTKSSTEDIVRHVIENAIRSDHMTGSEISHMALDTAIAVNGRTRNDNLGDFLMDLIVDEGSLEAAGEVEGGDGGDQVEDDVVVKHVVGVGVQAFEVEGVHEGVEVGFCEGWWGGGGVVFELGGGGFIDAEG